MFHVKHIKGIDKRPRVHYTVVMQLPKQENFKIYRVLVLIRGHDIGSLKVLAKSVSQASLRAEQLLQSKLRNFELRLLELGTITSANQEPKILESEV